MQIRRANRADDPWPGPALEAAGRRGIMPVERRHPALDHDVSGRTGRAVGPFDRSDIDNLDRSDIMRAVRGYRQRMAVQGGVYPDMKVTALLIIWSLPLLHASGHGQSLCRAHAGTTHADAHATSSVMYNARDIFFPDDPGSGSVGASLGDEEDDSFEDGCIGGGLLLSWSLPNLGRGNLTSLAPLRHDILCISSLAHPLRC